ncbi:MAG TPA: alpha-L-fucosidase [Phycisphaerae bacterium]|nr:alpha-L-fucosidase [Phycisphaerae bacterium]
MPGKPLNPVRRLRWFKEARFGMFVHWGLYTQLGRWEWTMHNERIPIRDYEKLADTWRPKARCMRQWARLARDAGMKYMVMTTKHHEGFCLWDSAQTDYNAARRAPGRDLVREYVEACREFGLRVGLYYSLLDWHHPDGMRAATDPAAAGRFREFSHNSVRELCSNYGPIDILWYDNNWPALADGGWKPERLNAMVRRLQPRILINNRSGTPEDFGTPEGHVTAESVGRHWEACMTMNGAWGYVPSAIDWVSVRQILEMLRTAAAGDGNLLLNIGPRADGSVPREASERLKAVGRWIAQHGEALYGSVDRADGLSLINTGNWTLKDKTAYFWASRWPDTGEIVMGRWEGKVKRATLLTTGKPVRVEQVGSRLFLRGLPVANPDRVAQVPVIKLECASRPRMAMDWSYEDPEEQCN